MNNNVYNMLKKIRETKGLEAQFDLSFSIPTNLAGVCVYVNDELALIAGYAFITNPDSFEVIKNSLHTQWMCQMNRDQIAQQNLPKYKIELEVGE